MSGALWVLSAGELLDTLPPGVDEMVAISNVVQFVKGPDYAHFTRIIFDTAPTGHTLRLLTLPDFLDASVGEGCSQCADCHRQGPCRGSWSSLGAGCHCADRNICI